MNKVEICETREDQKLSSVVHQTVFHAINYMSHLLEPCVTEAQK